MKKIQTKTTALTAATIPGSRAFIEAARRADALDEKADDAALLEAARRAGIEGEGFTAMYHSVAAANGLLVLLEKLVSQSGEPPDEMNWCAVANLIEECQRRLDPAEAALFCLSQYEKPDRDETGAADAA